MYHTMKILSITMLFNIDKKCFLRNIIHQHIRMISEGSWDTEDWSYDAENLALLSQE